jgi:hypothetical protein
MIKDLLISGFAIIIFSFSHNISSQQPSNQVSYCRGGLNILIPQFGTSMPDSVFVNLPNWLSVVDINVTIDTVLHTWDSDLRFYLRKGEVGVKVINNVGGSDDNFIGTRLDDSAAISIHSVQAQAPFTGTFKPSNRLSAFNLVNPDGHWILQITDTVQGDSGRLKAWCIQITTLTPTGVTQTYEIPNSYRLYPNYPNPFNPATKIKFALPENSHVNLTVFDALGKQVAVLVNESKLANTYEVDFDASSLPSGVYFYKLTAGEFTSTRKMLLVK